MALINYLTQVQFGYDALGQLAAECQRIGITRPFIVTDTGVRAAGIVDKVLAQLAEPAVAVDQLVKVYKTTRAVDGISFALTDGSVTGLLGGNGAGKTTTIAMILGLVMPTSGTCSARVFTRTPSWKRISL